MSETVLITGANRGIGLELTRLWRKRGDRVLAACRGASAELGELGAEVIEDVDVTTERGMDRLRSAVRDQPLDILFNNAGILGDESLENMDWDSLRRQFEVNTLGPLRVTLSLMDNLQRGSRVAMMSSQLGSIEENTTGGRYGYRISKAALNMAARTLAADLRSRGIAVILLHPGYVQTDMTGRQGNVLPEQAAAGLIQRVDQLTLDHSGSFWHARGRVIPW